MIILSNKLETKVWPINYYDNLRNHSMNHVHNLKQKKLYICSRYEYTYILHNPTQRLYFAIEVSAIWSPRAAIVQQQKRIFLNICFCLEKCTQVTFATFGALWFVPASMMYIRSELSPGTIKWLLETLQSRQLLQAFQPIWCSSSPTLDTSVLWMI